LLLEAEDVGVLRAGLCGLGAGCGGHCEWAIC
jgi:hypothetical protein